MFMAKDVRNKPNMTKVASKMLGYFASRTEETAIFSLPITEPTHSFSLSDYGRADRKKMIKLLGRMARLDIKSPESSETLCRAGERITLEAALAIRDAGQLDFALKHSYGVLRCVSPEEEQWREYADYLYDSKRDDEINRIEKRDQRRGHG